MKPLAERIKDFPAAQFVDWLCLACVDVREVRTPEDAQEEINKIREAVTERLSTLEDRLRIKQNHISLRDTYIEELESEQSEHDEQIARLQGKFDLAVAGMRSKTARCDQVEAELAEIKKQEPVAWMVGGWAFHDKKSAERRSEYDNLLMEPLFIHPKPATSLSLVSNCLSFFASVIKSGESWSPTCQRELDAARETLRNIEGAK